MTTATHAAVGAAVGSLTVDPIAALIAGVSSHIVLDVVPHYDVHDYRIDVLLTVLVISVLIALSGNRAPVMLGMIGGFGPDLENLAMKLGKLAEERRIFPTHVGPLAHGRALGPVHASWQVLLLAVALWRSAA
jgi:hypothetical protein